MITINKVSFEFYMEGEPFARALYGNWDSFCRVAFETTTDRVLSRFDTSGEIIRLESLVIDLGKMEEAEFYDLFPKRLTERLQSLFSAFISDPEAYSRQLQIIPASKSKLETLAFYLQHGYFHWETEIGLNDFQCLVELLLQTDADPLCDLIRSFGVNEMIRQRLVTQLSDKMLESVILLLEPIEGNFINNYSRVLTSLYSRTGHSEIGQQDFRDVVRNLVFAYLLYPNRGYFNRKQFVWQTISGLSRKYNIHLLSLIDLLSSQVKVLSEGQSLLPELFLILTDIRKEVKLDEPVVDTVSDLPCIEISEYLKEKQIPEKENSLLTIKINEIMELGNSVSLEVANAGLVLFNPFLPRLFSVLGYLTDDRSSFRNEEFQRRAIFVLQHIVSEGKEFSEIDLSLNKLLTGYPLSSPLPRSLELSEEEKDTVLSLQQAILQNWSKMKNTSYRGFCETFVRRRGKLVEEDQYWTLTVEERAVDVLMPSIPWSYSMVKYPFMPKAIQVKWR
ncbi:contractile injection system tape measure protein [uncultured Parabacteroides sp.]|uniref:contractile injection system tape measure protein n=1 Tax=uncultured Parabacteroides sp. TaxID=512312 RepID=UPI002805CC52|nr:contractile injection system tape measure protein [uncultured Parabacteroides sp.]